LLCAIDNCHIEVAQLLIEMGADVTINDKVETLSIMILTN